MDWFRDGWLRTAGLLKSGTGGDDEDCDLRPEADEALTRTVAAAVWFGITTGHLALTGQGGIPREYSQDL